jgi:hypothetical protein
MSRSCSAPAASVSKDSWKASWYYGKKLTYDKLYEASDFALTWIFSMRGHCSGSMPANALHSMAARGTAQTNSESVAGRDFHFWILASIGKTRRLPLLSNVNDSYRRNMPRIHILRVNSISIRRVASWNQRRVLTAAPRFELKKLCFKVKAESSYNSFMFRCVGLSVSSRGCTAVRRRHGNDGDDGAVFLYAAADEQREQ